MDTALGERFNRCEARPVHDRIGKRLQHALDTLETSAAGRGRLGSIALGVALAVVVVVGGLATFILALVILVCLVP